MPDIDAIHRAYLSAPEEAVFLDRARVLHECMARYAGEPAGVRQGRALLDLCERVTPVVNPCDVFLGRVLEEVPGPDDETFVLEHPGLFTEPGVPGFLDSASIYIPDWSRLLEVGIGELPADDEGVRLSLAAVSRLAERYADEADRAGGRLARVAADCRAIAHDPPRTFRQAVQLFLLYHMVVSCLVGGRNVTPGRMDQWLLRFYKRDLAVGRIDRAEAVQLLAAAMVMMCQGAGPVAVDFQSRKRTPNRFSHLYITVGGTDAEGGSAVNDLSHAVLEARRLVRFRDPSICVRHFPSVPPDFMRKVLDSARDRLPILFYSDRAVTAGLTRHGVPPEVARDYAHCACLICFLPGCDLPPARGNHNGPAALLAAMASADSSDFEDTFAAFRRELRASLDQSCASYGDGPGGDVPLVARPLFRRPGTRWVDQHLVGLATTVDSLLALRGDRARYGDPAGDEMAGRVARAWVEEVEAAGAGLSTVRLRPGFHSWLYNIEMGRATGATPDGRPAGEPLSSDTLPSPGRGLAPTETLGAMARLPHEHCASGGTTLRVSPDLFLGEEGLDRLAGLVEGYFAEGGLQLHLTFADAATLRDAMAHPAEHADLLVRVTGFSEYFVRLQPDVQQEIIRRAAAAP